MEIDGPLLGFGSWFITPGAVVTTFFGLLPPPPAASLFFPYTVFLSVINPGVLYILLT